ncbi:MAG: NAD(P)/FAD-dependent oxidoreductase [Candidatus Thermoplasmatota archaeon]
MKNFDVAIVGGGVVGSAIAFELSKYNLDVSVIEKECDVAFGTSKANSGVVHSGINSNPGTLKARFCVEGNQKIKSLADELGFSYKNVGKYIIAKNDDEIKELEKLKKVGVKNNVPGLEIHDKSIVNKKEPNVQCKVGLWVPTAGIILPYEFTITLAENAAINGVDFFLKTKVKDVEKKENHFFIKTNNGVIQSDILINAAGLNCRKIVSMLEEPDFDVYPCRGEYLILDKNYSHLITSMIYPTPVQELGVLGVHITPTVEGNILLGPSAEFVDDSDDKRTTKNMMDRLYKEAKEILPALPKNAVINCFSGIRCKLAPPEEGGMADFRIEESKNTSGLINILGIESPGLTASPAIANYVLKMVSNYIDLKRKKEFKIRKKRKKFSELSHEKRAELINKNPNWGRIVCRCEHVTEAEVIQALSNPLGAKSISSIKYRCRAGMGRCQSGFCLQHMVRILENEFKQDIEEIKLNNQESYLFTGRTREKA